MMPLGVLASARHASGGSYLLNDVFGCNVAHSAPAHSAAGHMLAGAAWQQSHDWYVEPTVDLLCARQNSYNSRVVSDVGSPQVTVTANIVGQVSSTSRAYGLVLGATSISDATNAVVVIVDSGGQVTASQTPLWENPTIGRGGAAISDDYILSLSLTGTTVTVGINGSTFSTFTVPNAVPGNFAGVFGRGLWGTSLGYRWITVEASS